jgi:hypothetical protein
MMKGIFLSGEPSASSVGGPKKIEIGIVKAAG